MTKPYPTIEFNRESTMVISEREFDGNQYQKAIDPFIISGVLEIDIPLNVKEFEKLVVEFKIDDNRRSVVEVFVECSIMRMLGKKVLTNWIEERAAWFFTYGIRSAIYSHIKP